ADDEADDDEADDDEADDDEADDDEADDDEADDDEADDDEADDDEADDDEAAATHEKKKSSRRKGKRAPRRDADGLTPGQRLARAKAAKAARKSKERGHDAEQVEEAAIRKAEEWTGWLKRNRNLILGVVAAAAIGLGGFIYFNSQSAKAEAEAGAALQAALETASAPIVPDSEEGESGEEETYPTNRERAEAALEKFEAVAQNHAGSGAEPWANLGAGNVLLQLERAEDARAAFEKALAGAADSTITWRALEGIAFSYELDENWDEAISRFQRLGSSGEGEYRDIADYHLSRMHLQKEDKVRAQELLESLIERLDEREEDAPDLPFLENQARLRLTELDPSFARRSTPSFDFPAQGGPDTTDPQIQEIIRQLQEAQSGMAP
ncbi:MAG: tetratricopeptide repeat protein, partial [Myxococcota bacterium]